MLNLRLYLESFQINSSVTPLSACAQSSSTRSAFEKWLPGLDDADVRGNVHLPRRGSLASANLGAASRQVVRQRSCLKLQVLWAQGRADFSRVF